MKRTIIQLGPEHEARIAHQKEKTGASAAEIIRRLILTLPAKRKTVCRPAGAAK